MAARQAGQISTRQLLECGLSRGQVRVRAGAGRLHPVHRGVWSVGVPVHDDAGRWWAAVLAGGPGAVLSHRSAAAAWEVWPNARSAEHVTVLRGRSAPRPGLEVHRVRWLQPEDLARTPGGVPSTAVPRTLLDLAVDLAPRQLDAAVTTARVQGLVREDDLRDVLARHDRRPGAGRLARALAGPLTRSRLERAFLALLSGSDLPAPVVNARVRGMEVDAVWEDAGLAVELDGGAAHCSAAAFARDRRKDERLRDAGWVVVRLTWWDVVRDGARTLATVRDALERARGTRSGRQRA